MILLTLRSFYLTPLLLFFSCSSLSDGRAENNDHPHFRHIEAFFYNWSPGTPGPVGTNYIFKFVPTGESPDFRKVLIRDESEKPDVSTKGDTIVLMVQKSGRKKEAFKGKGASENDEKEATKRAAEKASIRYILDKKTYSFEVEKIPKKHRTTTFE